MGFLSEIFGYILNFFYELTSNYGIAIIPRIPFLEQFNVKILPITNPKHERYIYLASVRNQYVTPSITAFKNFLLSHSQTLLENTKK